MKQRPLNYVHRSHYFTTSNRVFYWFWTKWTQPNWSRWVKHDLSCCGDHVYTKKEPKVSTLNCHMQLCATETQHLCKFHTQTNQELSFSLIGFHVQCLSALCKPSKSAFRLARVQLGARCTYCMEFCKVRLLWCGGGGSSVRGWRRGKARIVHNKPISFFSPHRHHHPLFFPPHWILYWMPSSLTQCKSLTLPIHALINMQRLPILI